MYITYFNINKLYYVIYNNYKENKINYKIKYYNIKYYYLNYNDKIFRKTFINFIIIKFREKKDINIFKTFLF